MIEKKQIQALYWDKKYTVEEIANKLNVSFWTLYNFMEKYGINRRDRSEAGYNYNRIKPQFEIKSGLSFAEEKLKVAGIMLYWAEGTLKGQTVDFANSNPEMIKIFLKFLREICGVSEERLRVYLYAYTHHNLRNLRLYWHRITRLSLVQFTKPYVRKHNPNLSNRKLPYGLVHIRYNDKKLLELIKSWIEEYKNNVLNLGRYLSGQKGQTVISSVLPKGRMEK
ncbi:MAG: hypothetical protein WC658_02310 [Candidatus Omnitrophota bacterium]